MLTFVPVHAWLLLYIPVPDKAFSCNPGKENDISMMFEVLEK